MTTLIWLEFRKLLDYRSVKLAALVLFILPWIWSFAPALQETYNLVLVSAYQMPALSVLSTMEFLLPLLVAVTAAEMIGSEVSGGTLSPLLLRPIERYKVLGAKLLTAFLYPFALLFILWLGSMFAGLRFGLGDFIGGTGLTPEGFAGTGLTSVGEAFGQILRAYGLAGFTLLPVAAMGLLYAVLTLNTAASALATVATLGIMRLFVAFPALKNWLLTSHMSAYMGDASAVLPAISVVALYTVGCSTVAFMLFERKDL